MGQGAFSRQRENIFEIFENHVLVGFDNFPEIKFCIDRDDYENLKDYYFYPAKDEWAIRLKIYKDEQLFIYSRYVMNAKEGEYVDHIYGDTFDNRKKNLRIITNQQNGFNHKLFKNNTSGFSGVLWSKQKEKWQAVIKFNYKTFHLGFYEDKSDAVYARLQGELKYFGIDFAPQRHLFEEYGII